jgi:hypothetical protein
MASPITNTEVTLIPVTFPDFSSKVIRAYLQVNFSVGSLYATGGVYAGLIPFADSNTIDANGFLKASVQGEQPVAAGGTVYTFRYSPIGDVLQIFGNGTELPNGSNIPSQILADTLLLTAEWDRTTTRG